MTSTITISIDEYQTLNDKSKVYDAVCDSVKECRISGMFGVPLLSEELLPKQNSTGQALASWSKLIIAGYRKQATTLHKHIKFRFGIRSEKRANRIIKEVHKAIDKNTISRSAYVKQKEALKLTMSQLQNNLDSFLSSTAYVSKSVKITQDQLTLVEKAYRKLCDLKVIDDEDIDTNTSNTCDSTPNVSNVSNNSNTQKGNEIGTKHSLDNESSIEKKQAYKQERKTARKTASRKALPFTVHTGSLLSPFYMSDNNGQAINPATFELFHSYNIKNKARCIECIDIITKNMNEIKSQTLVLHGPNGEEVELNGATISDIQVLNPDGSVQALLDEQFVPQVKIKNEDAKKNELNHFLYSEHLLKIMTVDSGRLIYSPTSFRRVPAAIYGARPLFVGCSISQNHAIKLLNDYLVLQVPKSRLHDQYNLLDKGNYYTREYTIELINSIARMLSPLAKYMRLLMLENCRTFHNDETTYKVMEYCEDGKQQKSYMWALVAGKREKYRGVLFAAAKDRSIDEFLKQFCYNKNNLEEILPKIKMENLITDGYGAYDHGVEILENILDRKIRRCGCFVHLRRYFKEALAPMGLSDVYDEIAKGPASGYSDRCNEIIARTNTKCNRAGYDVMFATFIIDNILKLEYNFEDRTKKDLEKTRRELSKPILNQFFNLCEEMATYIPGLESYTDKRGMKQYRGGDSFPFAKAVRYALNQRKALSRFVEDADIDLNNTWAELAIRDIVVQRKTAEFLVSADAYRGYADIMTIFATCRQLEIDPYEYMQFAVQNMKFRLEEYRVKRKSGSNAQICKKPGTQKDEQGKRISMYDENYECAFDMVDCEGLDPWNYLRLLDLGR